jgi:ubiquinone biosynthesis UbiH/UbiF/VisC/COQ6 family hydroxylase
LTCANHNTLTADLLIGADGARSQLRDLAQININTHDYQQTALVTLVQAEASFTPTALQHFLPEGPLALLPVGSSHYAVVWSNTQKRTAELLNCSNQKFNQAISQAGHPYSGTLKQIGERYSFPLRSQTAQAYVKPGIALVGDAAHVIHPLAGQGVNLGLLDVRVLIDTLVEARTQREPLGRFGVLRRYERARRGHNQMMQHSMDAFHYAYTHTHPGIRWIRNIGLGLVQKSPVLRRQCERIALTNLLHCQP